MFNSILYFLYKAVDPQLNYGREAISDLVRQCGAAERILDIAAGSGTDLKNAHSIYPDAHLTAFDFCQESVIELKKFGIRAQTINLEHDIFPVEAKSFDIVIANQILEHTKEIFWIFDQITKSLRPGGHLIIGVPNLASLHNRILLAVGVQPTPIRSASAHIRGFTKNDLLDFIESCFPNGLKLVGYKGSNFYPFPPVLARPLAALLPSMAWGNFYSFRLDRPYSGEFLRFPEEQKLETNFFTGCSSSQT